MKLKTQYKEGLHEPHFYFLTRQNVNSGIESLKPLNSVRMKVEELKQVLMVEEMHRILVLLRMMCANPTMTYKKVPATGSHTIDLFTTVQDVDLELVKDWSKYLTSAG